MCSSRGLLIAGQALALLLARIDANAFNLQHGFVQAMANHAYVFVFGVVLAEQSGLPIPAIPFLLVAGALSKTGQLSFGVTIALAVLACLIGDLSWYQIGFRHGSKVLGFVCHISLEPDSCVRRTEDIFYRHRERALLLAKFVPGLSTVAPALSGVLRMSSPRFLFFDLSGAILWAGSYMGVGYLFGKQIDYM
ncbi:MAG: DedA family protein, partial [Blastocatellia bacterium]